MPATTSSPLQRPINHNILNQHIEEAAFCWLRRQEALWRPSYHRAHLQRLDQLLDAHLEGIRVAGPAALPLAVSNLERWKTPDEVFACTYTLLQGSAVDWFPLERVLEAQPSAAKGAAAALIWNAGPSTKACLQRWIDSTVPALRVASTSAIAVIYAGDSLAARTDWLAQTLSDPATEVRARALRCIGEWRLPALAEHLQEASNGEDALCRFESACSMAWLRMPQADVALLETLPLVDGNRQRRGALLFALTAQPDVFDTWIQRAQANDSLSRALIWSLAFRGDACALTKLIEYVRVPQYAQLVAYAIGHITGLDVDEQRLWQPENQNSAEIAHCSEDDGLLMPDIEPLIEWATRYLANMPSDARLLAGQCMSPDHVRPLLQTGSQPQRWQASALLDMEDRRGNLLSQVPSPLL